ncbi:isoleucine--tRNA ligase [Eggerthellaceae bacterium zg-1084]|uniref:Isoleucine--tRNA ligase n=1 Tax=Berryella wangjianweii TaxID=2734634 RepID=A0A6M8J4N0_9ACTN|nr:isoleucine--tRNA ligase [Berryella wangjianweii]NPD31411.1 isoleucine--tRNA ligase [Berryella wangjianweii]QKF06946.1 isoleucine--tRNA ligase [Berryella wangjianweii]
MATSYKSTMNLPQTSFSMKANLAQNEPKRLEKWNRERIYETVLEKNRDGKPFILHDGPPYANGPIHIGHAFNKILKDFVLKSHAQRGFFTPYIPGWDCHGQPIEHMVETTLGPEKMARIDQPTLRRLCREWAEKYVGVQREGFRRLGVNADWEHPYLTYLPTYESGNVEVFKSMYLDGSVYRGRKPIHWCKRCHTALAEAEIEYGDETSSSLYVRFRMNEMPARFAQAGAEGTCWVLIWTTTAWTLPANAAVCLAPDASYVLVRAGGVNHLMAEALVEKVAGLVGWDDAEVLRDAAGSVVTYRGDELAGLTYVCPVRQDRVGTFIYGDHVTLGDGTGVVHTAPGHGQDDYLVGQRFDVPIYMPVDDDGRLTAEAGERFAGMDTDEVTRPMIDFLRDEGVLVAELSISHSYPHCWRCHQPVIFRATDQWFVSMDKTDLRAKALSAIDEQVRWVPAWAKNRIGSMVADRPDWCISRQRSWGVPIPVFKCGECGSTIADEATFDAVIDLFNREGADAWFTREPREYLPEGTCCPQCGSTEVLPERDILDVWWESGVSHTSVCRHRADEGLTFPADMYLEGSDQHRGWFQSSLLTSVGAYGTAPYRSVMHCGFTVDENGEKMSKSKGNGIDPADVTSRYGADILRLWVSSVDYSQDVRVSDSILDQVAGTYRRFRNTLRFLLGSLGDFDFRRDAVTSWDQLAPLDQWMMLRTRTLLRDVERGYDEFRYHNVYRAIYDFVVGDLSAVYMESVKDRLYSEAPDSPARRSAQTVLMNVLEVMVRILTPILSFTTDEVWENYPAAELAREGRPVSVQLAGWFAEDDFAPAIPADAEEAVNPAFACLFEVRAAVLKQLEEERAEGRIAKSQESRVEVSAPAAIVETLEGLGAAVCEELFVVSGVSFQQADELAVRVLPAEGEKCPRCWNYRELGVSASHPAVCARCADVLDRLGFTEDE